MRNGIYAKPIREIYDELDKETEQLFQIVDRRTYDLVLDEMERIINKNMYLDEQPFYLFTKECHKTFKDVYFVVGKWRLGMCGIFIKDVIDDVYILCDTKEDEESQKIIESKEQGINPIIVENKVIKNEFIQLLKKIKGSKLAHGKI